MKTANEYLTEKDIHPKEPIYWYTGITYLTIEDAIEEYAEPYKSALESIKQIALSRKKGSIQAILEIIGELEK